MDHSLDATALGQPETPPILIVDDVVANVEQLGGMAGHQAGHAYAAR